MSIQLLELNYAAARFFSWRVCLSVFSLSTVQAQEAASPVIGYLNGGSPFPATLEAFRRGLGDEGFSEGRNVTIEFRWAEGNYNRLPELAADLVKRNVAVIAAGGGDLAARAAKTATWMARNSSWPTTSGNACA